MIEAFLAGIVVGALIRRLADRLESASREDSPVNPLGRRHSMSNISSRQADRLWDGRTGPIGYNRRLPGSQAPEGPLSAFTGRNVSGGEKYTPLPLTSMDIQKGGDPW